MNSKMTTNSQLSTAESKKQTKQTTKTGTESQIWRSCVELLAGRRRKEENGRKGAGIKKHKWQVQNRQGMLRIVQEMEKPRNLYVQPMDMT